MKRFTIFTTLVVPLFAACTTGSPGGLGMVHYRSQSEELAPVQVVSACEYETGLAAGGMYVPRDSLMRRCMELRGYHQTIEWPSARN